jgi:ferredoxin-NADP reductase
MVHHDIRIPITVTRRTTETLGYLSVFFERPQGFSFMAGDWMDINLPNNQPEGGTTYSFASSPDEPELQITFREGVSPFKKVLGSLNPGDKMVITEYGNDYGFQLKEHRASVLIAGGVGVAPFRSMLKEMDEQASRNSVQLIYLNTTEDFLYKSELDKWQERLRGINVHYIATKAINRKERNKVLAQIITDPLQQFYVSGPSGMIESTTEFLQKIGVENKNIKLDDFGLY